VDTLVKPGLVDTAELCPSLQTVAQGIYFYEALAESAAALEPSFLPPSMQRRRLRRKIGRGEAIWFLGG
jgi:hypothetical protein